MSGDAELPREGPQTRGEDTPIHVNSLYGLAESRGMVDLTVGPGRVQMTPTKARMIAGWLLEAAAAAEGDDAFARFLREMEADTATVAAAMQRYRALREAAVRDNLAVDHG